MLVSDSETDSSTDDETEKQKIMDAVVNSAELQPKHKLRNDVNTMKNGTDGKDQRCQRKIMLPSLRPSQNEIDRGQNELNTTPEFRNFVAKKLSQMLDKELETRLCAIERNDKQDTDTVSGIAGIKLFRESNDVLNTTFDEEVEHFVPQRKRPDLLKRRRHNSSSDSSEEEKKFAEAAVSCDFIIQQSRCGLSTSDQSKQIDNKGSGDCVSTGNSEVKRMCTNETSKNCFSKTDFSSGYTATKKKKKKKHKNNKELKL